MNCWLPDAVLFGMGCFNPHSPLLANEFPAITALIADKPVFQSTFAIAGE